MLDAFRYLLCSKLCQHNRLMPNFTHLPKMERSFTLWAHLCYIYFRLHELLPERLQALAMGYPAYQFGSDTAKDGYVEDSVEG